MLCQSRFSVSCFFLVCCFITVTKLKVTACSSPSPTTPTLRLIHSVFFLFCHVESNHMKPHTLSPGGTSSSSTTLPVIFDTQTHTPSLIFQWQQSSLTPTAAHILFFFLHFSQTLDSLARPVLHMHPLSLLPL